MPKAETSNSVAGKHRNTVERQRQRDIDDEIQKLMCFLPQRDETQKMSRNQILTELHKVALENMKDVHAKSTQVLPSNNK